MVGRGIGPFSNLFRRAYARPYRRFRTSLSFPQQTQEQLLAELLSGMRETEYGKHYGMAQADRYEEFAAKLPIVTYEDISPWIQRQRTSTRRIICPEPIAFYERTSGSSGRSKLVPYTQGLRNSFVRMFLLWVYDILSNGPSLHSGSTFLSVSPKLRPQAPYEDDLDAGLNDDTEYLPRALRWLVGRYLVAPLDLRAISDAVIFRRVLAAYLLDEPGLEVVSVWNPSYLTSLLDFIDGHRDLIAEDLRSGKINAGGRLFRLSSGTAARRREIVDWLRAGGRDFGGVWPEMKLLSCWTDGNAALMLDTLRLRLPRVTVQGKGLIATEGPMTIPLWESSAPVPLLSEIFFEFIDATGRVVRLHELELGARYDIVMSQRGGMMRYRIGDRVEVAGLVGATPALRFVGRSQNVSDLVGEKLNETFVRDALREIGALASGRWMLLPTSTSAAPHYVCLYDGPRPSIDLDLVIDQHLQESHQYHLARQLGQLGPVEVRHCARLDETFLAWNASEGRKLGNVKPCILLSGAQRAASFLQHLSAVRNRESG